MAKKIFFSLVVLLLVAGALWKVYLIIENRSKMVAACTELRTETVESFFEIAGKGSATALCQSETFLTEKKFAEYDRRINFLKENVSPGKIVLSDSYEQILLDLESSLSGWSLREILKIKDPDCLHDTIGEDLLRETPYYQIIALRQAVQEVGMLEFKLILDQEKPTTLEGVAELRQEFLEKKETAETALKHLKALQEKKVAAAG